MPIVELLAPHFSFVTDPTAWVALLTLIVLEVVLGIDNLIFISILTNKLPEAAAGARPPAGHRRGADHAAGSARHHLDHRAADRRRCSPRSATASPGAT